MENKACDNCLFEYFCDWSPAGDNNYCEYWKSEIDSLKVKSYKGEKGDRNVKNF